MRVPVALRSRVYEPMVLRGSFEGSGPVTVKCHGGGV